jgi:hypothetical protein
MSQAWINSRLASSINQATTAQESRLRRKNGHGESVPVPRASSRVRQITAPLCPGGASESSPAIQRRERRPQQASASPARGDRNSAEPLFHPSGTCRGLRADSPSDESLGSDLLIPRLGVGATWNYPDTIPFGATLIINELWRVNLIGGVRNGFSHFPRDQEVWGYCRSVPPGQKPG